LRLISLASQWFFRSGRIEEGILELDRLGDLNKVDDSTVLITAARFCDLDPQLCVRLLQRAPSIAISKEERWHAQFALAERLFNQGANEESLRVVDAIICESSTPEGSPEALGDATMLRWRITKSETDFQSAMTALKRDRGRNRHAGILIDEGRYDDAEALLAEALEAGELVSRLLIIDARIRAGKSDSAHSIFLAIDHDHVPARLQYPHAAACALLALSLRDDAIRRQALASFGKLPDAAFESDMAMRTFLSALQTGAWGEELPET
jgi:tetratricopeptide (TPR) repeat protein